MHYGRPRQKRVTSAVRACVCVYVLFMLNYSYGHHHHVALRRIRGTTTTAFAAETQRAPDEIALLVGAPHVRVCVCVERVAARARRVGRRT